LPEIKRNQLTLGVLLLILAIVLILNVTGAIELSLVGPIVLVLFGAWMLALATLRNECHIKYERSAFSTLSLGLMLVAAGGAWYLAAFNWIYSIIIILVVIAALIIIMSIKRK